MRLLTDRVEIAATGRALPGRIVANAEIVEGLETSDEWVRENLGIRERRVAELPDESVSRLAASAVGQVIERASLSTDEVGGLIVATSTPEQRAPSMACLVQDHLGIDNGSFAFDVQAVCSGFLYGVGVASSMIAAGAADNVVVAGADAFSTITDWDDRSSVFFGDGAGAVLLRATGDPEALLALVLHADGSGRDGFSVPPGQETFVMNPRAVYETGTTVLPDAVKECLELSGVELADVKHVVPHQPSRKVLDETARRLGIDPAVILRNMDRYANTAGATVPILLDETVEAGKLSEGDEIVMAAVGSGWTWGAAVYRWRA